MMPQFVFEQGDRMPDFTLPDVNGTPTGLLTHSRGRPLVLVLCDRDPDRLLAPLAARQDDLADADVFVVTRLTSADNAQLAQRLVLRCGVLSDRHGEILAALGRDRIDASGLPALACYLLDRNLRIAGVWRGEDPAALLDALTTRLGQPMGLSEAQVSFRPAPVLIVPEVLDRTFCRQLIELLDASNPERGGTFNNITGEGSQYRPTTKIRRDMVLSDRALQGRIVDLLGRRVVPEIARAYGFAVTNATDLKLCRYDGSEGGRFRPHRDNVAPGVAWRRFAMSLLLNDAAEYEGGGMNFAEYGETEYRANAGDAIVFSCSLLHEVMPVTAGSRYVLLSFLYGAEEQRMLQQNRGAAGPARRP